MTPPVQCNVPDPGKTSDAPASTPCSHRVSKKRKQANDHARPCHRDIKLLMPVEPLFTLPGLLTYVSIMYLHEINHFGCGIHNLLSSTLHRHFSVIVTEAHPVSGFRCLIGKLPFQYRHVFE